MCFKKINKLKNHIRFQPWLVFIIIPISWYLNLLKIQNDAIFISILCVFHPWMWLSFLKNLMTLYFNICSQICIVFECNSVYLICKRSEVCMSGSSLLSFNVYVRSAIWINERLNLEHSILFKFGRLVPWVIQITWLYLS